MESHQNSLQIIDTLRRLNRIFVHKRTTNQLLSEVCKTLISVPQFNSVWIAVIKPNKAVDAFQQEGLGAYGEKLEEQLLSKGLTQCSKLTIEKGGPFFVEKDAATCGDCSLLQDNRQYKSLTLPVFFQNSLLGVIAISVNPDQYLDKLEESLLIELSEDLGNALNTILLENNTNTINETINHLSKSISGNTSREVLNSFMLNMVKNLDSDYAFIGRLVPGYEDRIKTISVSTPDGIIENFEYPLLGTPCEEVINKDVCCHIEGVAELFPKDKLLKEMGIEAYIGAPLINSKQEVIGIMVVLKKAPFPSESLAIPLFKVFASRASSELIRFDTEQRILESEHQYQELIESSKNPIYIIVGNQLALVNSAWLDKFEFTLKEVKSPGFSIHQIVAPESMGLMQSRLDNFLSGISQPFRYELKAVSKSGRKFDLDVSVTHLNWQGKRAVQGIYRDITEAKKAERKLIKALKESREQAHMKTAFLSNLSQKFQTSLSQIIESAQAMILDNNGKIKSKEFADYIIKNSSLLLEHVNDIIDISQIEMGKVTLKPEKFNLSDLLKDVTQYFLPPATNKGIELTCCRKRNSSVEVMADPTRVRQILINMMSNAVKYTEKGKIHIDYILRQDDVRISIADTGIGIPPEKQKNIYESFLNPNGKLSGNYDGSGLGLAVTRSLVQLMGGKIWVESNPGGGSIFYFTIPLA